MVTRRRVRYVAKGYTQIFGVDYTDTYAGMSHPTAIRLILALAAREGWYLNSTDIKVVYLAAELHEQIF